MKACNGLLSIAARAGARPGRDASRSARRARLRSGGVRAQGRAGLPVFFRYQFAVSQRKFCEDVPRLGDDAGVRPRQDELRQMKLDSALRATPARRRPKARPRTNRPWLICRRKHTQGTFSFVQNFEEPGTSSAS